MVSDQTNQNQEELYLHMNSITSEARFRQRVVKYSYKHGVTAAGIRHQRSRQAIYEWRGRYDGEWRSLRERSHRPKSHPKQHTEEEKGMILRHWRYNKADRIVLWDTIRKKGYSRHYNSMIRVLNKWLTEEERGKQKAKKPKVERQHRCDEQRFYGKMRMYSLADGRTQLARYNLWSNNIPKICLGFLSPNEVLAKYFGVM